MLPVSSAHSLVTSPLRHPGTAPPVQRGCPIVPWNSKRAAAPTSRHPNNAHSFISVYQAPTRQASCQTPARRDLGARAVGSHFPAGPPVSGTGATLLACSLDWDSEVIIDEQGPGECVNLGGSRKMTGEH